MISTGKNLETKQTKTLAYMLAYAPDFLELFVKKIFQEWNHLNFNEEPELQWKSKEEQWQFEVKAEAVTKEKQRPDIILQAINQANKIDWMIVIEAKSMNVNASSKNVWKQLQGYIAHFRSSGIAPVIPVLLTKNIDFTYHAERCVTLTWLEVIDCIREINRKQKHDRLFQEFEDFLTGANHMIKFYEREVISIPAGKTFDLVKEFGVYICPNTRDYNYKNTLYMTFRRSGGIMETLYPVKALYVLRCDEAELNQLEMQESHRQAILSYLKAAGKNHPEKSSGMRVYILDQGQSIQLPQGTKPQITTQGMSKYCYYSLADMLDAKRSQALRPCAQNKEK